MNQELFLRELENLLSDIPAEERREAMEYYRCYFEDAGEENEEAVLWELGSPEKVAETIKADLSGETRDGGFTEKGYEEFTPKDVPDTKKEGKQQTRRTDNSVARIVFAPVKLLLILIMCVVTVVVVAGMIAVAAGLAASAVGVAAAAAGLVGIGIGSFVEGQIAIGVGLFCGGSFCAAIFFLLLLAVVAFCAKALPAAIRGVCNATASVCGGRRR